MNTVLTCAFTAGLGLALAGCTTIAEPANEASTPKDLSPAAGLAVKYPEVYITTNMRDDRVHAGHARKFAARLDVNGVSVDDGAAVIQWPCHGGDNQRWVVRSNSPWDD